jgi:hypothetical protein
MPTPLDRWKARMQKYAREARCDGASQTPPDRNVEELRSLVRAMRESTNSCEVLCKAAIAFKLRPTADMLDGLDQVRDALQALTRAAEVMIVRAEKAFQQVHRPHVFARSQDDVELGDNSLADNKIADEDDPWDNAHGPDERTRGFDLWHGDEQC